MKKLFISLLLSVLVSTVYCQYVAIYSTINDTVEFATVKANGTLMLDDSTKTMYQLIEKASISDKLIDIDKRVINYNAPHPSINIDNCTLIDAYLEDADTYYTLASDELKAVDSIGFTFVDTMGTITYHNGAAIIKMVFLGSAYLYSDNIANIVTFGLFKNGVVYPNAETCIEFAALNRINNMSINKIITTTNGDIWTVRARCDVAGTTISIKSLHLTFYK